MDDRRIAERIPSKEKNVDRHGGLGQKISKGKIKGDA